MACNLVVEWNFNLEVISWTSSNLSLSLMSKILNTNVKCHSKLLDLTFNLEKGFLPKFEYNFNDFGCFKVFIGIILIYKFKYIVKNFSVQKFRIP